MPSTSQFLGQCEWGTAHVGVVVRLGTVEHVFGALGGAEGGLCLRVKGQPVGLSHQSLGLASSCVLLGFRTGSSCCFPHL